MALGSACLFLVCVSKEVEVDLVSLVGTKGFKGEVDGPSCIVRGVGIVTVKGGALGVVNGFGRIIVEGVSSSSSSPTSMGSRLYLE